MQGVQDWQKLFTIWWWVWFQRLSYKHRVIKKKFSMNGSLANWAHLTNIALHAHSVPSSGRGQESRSLQPHSPRQLESTTWSSVEIFFSNSQAVSQDTCPAWQFKPRGFQQPNLPRSWSLDHSPSPPWHSFVDSPFPLDHGLACPLAPCLVEGHAARPAS